MMRATGVPEEVPATTVSGLPIHVRRPDRNNKETADAGRILILGNAYRLMPYQASLAVHLSSKGFECWWFPYHGQRDMEGSFSGQSAFDDLSAVIDYSRRNSEGKSLSIIAHCVSCLITAHYLANSESSDINSVVFYGFLRHHVRRRRIAETEFAMTGGRIAVPQWQWDYDPTPRLRSIEQPILFCQAEDELNQKRANREEIQEVASHCRRSETLFFPVGYDVHATPLSQYAEHYARWISSHSKRGAT